MNKIFGFITAIVLLQSMAYGQNNSPPFASMICMAKNVNIQLQVQLYSYQQTNGQGPAVIHSKGTSLSGKWHWQAAPAGTRLTGYYFLEIKASSQKGILHLKTIYSPQYGKLSGGWLEMPGVSESISCQLITLKTSQ